MTNGTSQNTDDVEAPATGPALPARERGTLRDYWPVLALVVAVWLPLLLKLRIDWSTNAQYEFGPFVPLFILVLLAQRWGDRPSAEPSSASSAIAVIVGGLFICLLPMRLIQEANPDWRPLNWVYGGVVVVLTLTAAAYLGGWRWVGHFAPPLVLIFFALPWPLAIEQGVIQSMARAVTAITTELLNFADIPALQQGNVIQVPTGQVGVEDACSGVRSLAGTLMASYFFGEFYRLGWIKRAVVILAGILIAFLLNLVRTFLLGWIAAHEGTAGVSNWHDQTGLFIFCAAFGTLWFLTSRLASGQLPARGLPGEPVIRSIPIWLFAGMAAWVLFVEIGTETWYRLKERDLPHVTTWAFHMPEQDPFCRYLPVSDQARAILRYSEGHSAIFSHVGYPTWQINFFQWAPGRSSSQLAVLHRPDICLPATGLRFVSSSPTAYVKLAGVTIPFDCTVFDTGGDPLYVFRTLSEDRRPLGSTSGFDQSIRGRLQSAWHGRRNLGQKLLQIGITGPESQVAALADLQARLPQFLSLTE